MDLRPSRRTFFGLVGIINLALVLLASSAFAAGRAPAKPFDRQNSDGRQFLIRSTDIDRVAAEYDLQVVRQLKSPTGDVWLVESRSFDSSQIDRHALQAFVKNDPAVSGAEPVTLASLPQPMLASVDPMEEASVDLDRSGNFATPCIAYYMGYGVWAGYGDQQATRLVRLHTAQALSGNYCGHNMVVAIIDTGVDPQHPLLEDALLEGYDFLSDTVGASEWHSLDTRTWAIVEEEMSSALPSTQQALLSGDGQLAVLDSMAAVLGQADLSTLGDELEELPTYFGHGTMVAGLVRLTAPGAKIMPLRVFDENGRGHPYDIVRAVYHAVANGADVINMSFSMAESSPELEAAIEYARHHGVMTVAATGNDGSEVRIYPAAYSATIGVAATDKVDHLATFSNYGLVTADITAPGSALITLYPGGYYAVGWGTSFSAPLVSGITAVTRAYHAGHNKGSHKKTRLDILLGSWYYPYLWDYVLASGRMDAVGALYYAVN